MRLKLRSNQKLYQMIDSIKTHWKKLIIRKERLNFLWVVFLLYVAFLCKMFYKTKWPFGSYHVILVAGLVFIVLSLYFERLGLLVYRLWTALTRLIFNAVFVFIEIVIYFLFLTPVFLILTFFKDNTGKLKSFWSTRQYINRDYKKMG